MNALQHEIRSAATTRMVQLDRANKSCFRRHLAPADGLRAYHCIIGAFTFSTWSEVSRNRSGIAVNPRLESIEARSAVSLRDHALQFMPTHNPTLAEQALEAQQAYSVDVCELSWLGEALGVSIRCSITQEAGCDETNVIG